MTDRAKFEAWAGPRGLLFEDGAWDAWTASRAEALEEAAKLCDQRAESICRVNTYRGKVNSVSQWGAEMVERAAAAIRAAASSTRAGDGA